MGKNIKKKRNLKKEVKDKNTRIEKLEADLSYVRERRSELYHECNVSQIIAFLGVLGTIVLFLIFLGATDNLDIDDAVGPAICFQNGMTFHNIDTGMKFGTSALVNESGAIMYVKENNRYFKVFCKTDAGNIVEITNNKEIETTKNNVEKLGTSICDQRYNKTFDSFIDGTLSCKDKEVEVYEKYDGIKVKI